jgi:hypothetical protein
MPPQIVDAIAALIAIFGLGTFSLIGLRMFLAHKAKRLELGSGRSDTGRLEDLVEELRSEVQLLRGDVGELHERVDFAERLLARGQGDGHPRVAARDAPHP